MRAHPRSSLTVAGVCALLALTSGCGVFSAETGPAPSAPATAAPDAAPAGTAVAADVDAGLVAIGATGRPASLHVEVTPTGRSLPALSTMGGLLRDLCRLPDDAVQVAAIDVVFTDRGPVGKFDRPGSSNLHAAATVVGGDGVAVVEKTDVRRSPAPEAYCPGGERATPETHLQTEELAQSHQTMTLYVTALTSPGSPEPLRGATLRLHDLGATTNDSNQGGWAWGLENATADVCPDDPNALCLPLG